MREWFTPGFSFLGALLFVLSSPFAESSQFLMERHYIEGLIFALLSFHLFIKSTSGNKAGLLLLSALLYLLACSAKEIYVPLIFMLLLFQSGSVRKRLIQILPFLSVLLLYVLWRWYMLGRLGGGYGLQLSWPQDAILLFPRMMNAVGSGFDGQITEIWRWLAGATSVAAVAIILIFDRKTFCKVLFVFPLVLLPIIPVSPVMTGRFLFLAVFFWILLCVIAWSRLHKHADGPIASAVIILWAAVLLTAFLLSSSKELRNLRSTIHRQGVEGEFVLRGGRETDLVINPKSPGHYYAGLSWLRTDILGLPAGPSVMADSTLLCLDKETANSFSSVWYVNSKADKMVAEKITDFIAARCNRGRLYSLRESAPLSLKLEYSKDRVSWEFGPYKEGEYQLLFERTAGTVYPLPPSGSRIVYLNDMTIPVRLRYASPQGWTTYSPLLNLRIFSDRARLDWKR
jgi:hypothetical protein